MDCILGVFDALATFDRPATRAEIETESGLDKRAVENGLAGLMRRQLLRIDGGPRMLTTYQLAAVAPRPETLRGRYSRTPGSILSAPRPYAAAMPPSHHAQPSAVRIVARGMLEAHSCVGPQTFGPCLLSEFWKKR